MIRSRETSSLALVRAPSVRTLVAIALCLAPALPAPSAAQEAAGLTLERIHASDDFTASGFDGTWMADGTGWARVDRADGGGSVLVRVEAQSGEESVLIGSDELVPAGRTAPLVVESFHFSPDSEKMLLFSDSEQVWRARTRGLYWVFDLRSRSLTPVSRAPGGQMFAKFSPDGSSVAFVRDHDLWLTLLATDEERRLTHDGGESIINGTTDWVYEEELGLRDAFRWSPDGTRIAYWQVDRSPVGTFHLVDETRLYPEMVPIRYPKAGTPNSTVRVGSLELVTGVTTWFDVDPADGYYITRMDWASSPGEVAIQTLNRHQNRLEILLGDAASGETRSLLVEEDEAWMDVNDDLVWIDGGERFLWTSDRDGWRHIYRYRRNGTLERRLTGGAWDVTGLLGVDDRGHAYFSAAYEGPLGRSVLRVDPGGDVEPIFHGERGTHGADFSPDFRHAIHTFSTIARPPVVTLAVHDDGEARTVRTLEDNAELVGRLGRLGLGEPEFITVDAADGTPLNAFLIKPADFDPAGSYGLLLYVYGGPGSQTAADRWGGSRYVWHHYLARHGVLVASVDNRGTGARGRDFKKQTYLRLGELETADQLAAASQLADRPWVDASRIGVWGWSYGGYMALMVSLQSQGTIAAAVSVAPVTHWKLYDTIYTERFMRTPDANPEGYAAGSPLSHADGLVSPLLIVHGTADDNVHPQNTIQMIEALERAGKQFDMRIYPGKRHGITGDRTRLHLFTYITHFLLRHLGPVDAAHGATDAG